jgi:hypothetical protein
MAICLKARGGWKACWQIWDNIIIKLITVMFFKRNYVRASEFNDIATTCATLKQRILQNTKLLRPQADRACSPESAPEFLRRSQNYSYGVQRPLLSK